MADSRSTGRDSGRITRRQFIRRAGVVGGAVAAAGLGLSGAARAHLPSQGEKTNIRNALLVDGQWVDAGDPTPGAPGYLVYPTGLTGAPGTKPNLQLSGVIPRYMNVDELNPGVFSINDGTTTKKFEFNMTQNAACAEMYIKPDYQPGDIQEGETFTIDEGGYDPGHPQPVTFEFDLDNTYPGDCLTPNGAVAVHYSPAHGPGAQGLQVGITRAITWARSQNYLYYVLASNWNTDPFFCVYLQTGGRIAGRYGGGKWVKLQAATPKLFLFKVYNERIQPLYGNIEIPQMWDSTYNGGARLSYFTAQAISNSGLKVLAGGSNGSVGIEANAGVFNATMYEGDASGNHTVADPNFKIGSSSESDYAHPVPFNEGTPADPHSDQGHIQWAVDNVAPGGTVVLKATAAGTETLTPFNLGTGMVRLTRDVAIMGESPVRVPVDASHPTGRAWRTKVINGGNNQFSAPGSMPGKKYQSRTSNSSAPGPAPARSAPHRY